SSWDVYSCADWEQDEDGNDYCADWEYDHTEYGSASMGGASHGSVSGSMDDFTYTPDPEYWGPDSIGFSASDDQGTAYASVNIYVNPPFTVDAENDSFSGDVGSTVSGNVLGNDSASDGSALSVDPQGSSDFALTSDGSFYYAGGSFRGYTSFCYTARSGDISDDACVTILFDTAP